MRKSKHLLLVLALFALPLASRAATVFSDNFSGSTLNSASPAAPTTTSTDYAVLSTKNASGSSIGASQLRLTMPATTSGFVEAQALFATTPLTLAATGDYVQLSATFTTTAGILAGPGTSSSLNFGLLYSGGVAPVAGGVLANTGLTTTLGSPYDTGNAAGWLGYVGRILENTGSSRVFTRPNQNGPDTTSESQDLLFDNVGGGAFDDPTGVAITANQQFGSILTAGSQYTYTLKLTLDAGTGFLTTDQNLYSGAGTGGANLFTQTGTSTLASTPTLQFDGFALGYRFAETVGAASTLDVSGLEITAQITPVPEPAFASLLLAGAGARLLMHRRRRA